MMKRLAFLLVLLAAPALAQSNFYSREGSLRAIGSSLTTGQIARATDGTFVGLAAPSDDVALIGNGTTWQDKTIPDCVDTGGNHLNYTASTNTLSCGTSGGAGGGAPADAQYVTLATDATLTQERVLTAGNYIDVTDGGAGTTVTVAMDPTEINDVSWGDNTDVSIVWTWQVLGIDVAMTFNPGGINVSSGTFQVGGVTLAREDQTYVTVGNQGALTAERAITAGAGLSGTDGGANSTYTLATSSTEAAFLADGGVTSLTCGSSNQGKMQVLDSGALEWCDGATTSALKFAAPGESTYLVIGGDALLTNERHITDGAGILLTDNGAGASLSVATNSGETGFLASGALTCGASTAGKMQVHTTPLQYCDNAATPALQYAAYGNSSGESTAAANTSVTLTSDVTGTLPVANGGTNLTAASDDNVMVGNATTWQSKAIPDCDDTGGNHLNYDTTGNAFSCGTSSSGGGGGDVTDVGPGCATGACWTDGVATAGTSLLIWEGTTANTAEFTITVPLDPSADITWTVPDGATALTFPSGTHALAVAESAYVTVGTDIALPNSRSITAGTGMDLADGGAGSTITINFDSTEIAATTWGSGVSSFVWTFDASAGVDPDIGFASGLIHINSLAADVDFAVSGDTVANLLGVDGGAEYVFTSGPLAVKVGGAPTGDLHVKDSSGEALFRLEASGINQDSRLELVSANESWDVYVDESDGQALKVASDTLTAAIWSTNGRLDLTTGANLVALSLADGNTDATDKRATLAGRHYTNAEESVGMIHDLSASTANRVMVGGGVACCNAATQIEFYTAANSTTLSGTQRGQVNTNGRWSLGDAYSQDAARLAVREGTIGSEVFRLTSIATNDDPQVSTYQQRTTTSGNTKAYLWTLTTSSDTAYQIKASVLGHCTAGSNCTADQSAGYELVATIINDAGTASVLGTMSTVHSAESASQFNATIDAGSVDCGGAAVVCVEVTGFTNYDITWHGTVEVAPVQS